MAIHRSLILSNTPANETDLAMLRAVSDDIWRAGTWATRFLLQGVCILTKKLPWRSGHQAADATTSSLL